MCTDRLLYIGTHVDQLLYRGAHVAGMTLVSDRDVSPKVTHSRYKLLNAHVRQV